MRRPKSVKSNPMALLPAEQSAFQQRLHVTAAVGDYQNKDLASGNSIDQPIRPEQDLPEFADTERIKLLGYAAAQRKALKGVDLLQKDFEEGFGIIDRAVLSQIVVDRLEIVLGTLCQFDIKPCWLH